MDRAIHLIGGPRGGETGRLHKQPDGWPVSLLLATRDGRGARYRRHSNSRFTFDGFETIPTDEVTVEVVETEAGWVFRDPRGLNDYRDMPTIATGTPEAEVHARATDFFAGGKTHFKFIPRKAAA